MPLAVDLAKASEDSWERSLLELFPDFRHSAEMADVELPDDPDEESDFMQRAAFESLRLTVSPPARIRTVCGDHHRGRNGGQAEHANSQKPRAD